MFAYCLNNPVNRIDDTGTASLWYYLIVDHDMGFIHRAVQSHIAYHYGVSTEVMLSTYGRADVMHEGAVWEIKHSGQYPEVRAALAQAQAFTYVCVNAEAECMGAANAFNGNFYIQCLDYAYLVEYSTPYDGVVLYSVTGATGYQGEYYVVYVPKTIRQKDSLRKPTKVIVTTSTTATAVGLVGVLAMGAALSVAGGSNQFDQVCLMP